MHIYHIFAQSWFRLVLSSSILVGTSILLISFSWAEISLIIMIRPPATHPRQPVQEHVGRRNRILHRYETSQVTEKIWSMVIDTAISLNQNNNPIQSTRITTDHLFSVTCDVSYLCSILFLLPTCSWTGWRRGWVTGGLIMIIRLISVQLKLSKIEVPTRIELDKPA